MTIKYENLSCRGAPIINQPCYNSDGILVPCLDGNCYNTDGDIVPCPLICTTDMEIGVTYSLKASDFGFENKTAKKLPPGKYEYYQRSSLRFEFTVESESYAYFISFKEVNMFTTAMVNEIAPGNNTNFVNLYNGNSADLVGLTYYISGYPDGGYFIVVNGEEQNGNRGFFAGIGNVAGQSALNLCYITPISFSCLVEKEVLPLKITCPESVALTSSSSNFYYPSATGGVPPYTWSKNPSVGVINSTTGVIDISKAKSNMLAVTITYTYIVQVIVTDSESNTDSCTFGFTVNGVPPIPNPTTLSITTNSISNGTVGASYSQTFTATGGTGSYTWNSNNTLGYTLPAGLSLSTSGVLSGTPTTAVSDKNIYISVISGSETVFKLFKISITESSTKQFNVTQSTTFTECPIRIIYANGYFIISCGEESITNRHCCLYYSSNGTTWTKRTYTPDNLPFASMVYMPSDNGRIYAVGPDNDSSSLGEGGTIVYWTIANMTGTTSFGNLNTNQLRERTTFLSEALKISTTGDVAWLVGKTTSGSSTILVKASNTSSWVSQTVSTVNNGLDWAVVAIKNNTQTFYAGNNTVKTAILKSTTLNELGSSAKSTSGYPGLKRVYYSTDSNCLLGANSTSNIYTSLDGINWNNKTTSFIINVTKPIRKNSTDILIAAGEGIASVSASYSSGVITNLIEDSIISNANIVDFAYAPDKNMLVFISGKMYDTSKTRCAYSCTY